MFYVSAVTDILQSASNKVSGIARTIAKTFSVNKLKAIEQNSSIDYKMSYKEVKDELAPGEVAKTSPGMRCCYFLYELHINRIPVNDFLLKITFIA